MLSEVLVWCLKWYFIALEMWKMTFKVLSIKYKIPKQTKHENEVKGHLALRLNDTKVLKSEELVELIQYVHTVFGIKYLTLITGNFGFEREIDISIYANVNLYHNYEQVAHHSNDAISVNLVDNDSEALFLLKLKEHMSTNANELITGDYDSVYKISANSFTSTFEGVKEFCNFTHF
jgi:hypothetical protein